MIDVLVEHVQKGNNIDSTFNDQAWDYMLISFNTKLGMQCDRTFLEDRYLWLRNQFDGINKLLSCSGFTLDETRFMVTADNDVWEAYIKVRQLCILYLLLDLY